MYIFHTVMSNCKVWLGILDKMTLSYYSYAGYGLLLATIFGIDKYGLSDYRVMGLFILSVCLLMVDVIRYYRIYFREKGLIKP